MAKITKGMVEHLNKTLKSLGCGFRYEFTDEQIAPKINMVVADNNDFVSSSIINCTDKYYKWLDEFFYIFYGITLRYNNTGTICWSDDFSDNE